MAVDHPARVRFWDKVRAAYYGARGVPTMAQDDGRIMTFHQVMKALMEESEADEFKQQSESTAKEIDAKRAYRQFGEEAINYAAVFAIMSTGASTPLVFRQIEKDDDGNDQVVDAEHPALTLLLKRANPWQSFYDLMEAVFAYLELVGSMPLEVTVGSDRVHLYPCRPDMLTPKGDAKNLITHYEYKDPSTSMTRNIKAENIIYIKAFNPTSARIGLSSSAPSFEEVDMVIDAFRYNADFFARGAVPEGGLTTDQKLTPAQVKRYWRQWMKQHQGKGKSRLPAIFHSGLKWESYGISHKDMDFEKLIKMARESTLSARGVPPILVGLLEYSHYNTGREQKKLFYQHTMTPKFTKVQDALNAFLLPVLRKITGVPTLFCEYDLSEVEALQEDQNERSRRVRAEFTEGLIKRNEAREKLKYEPVPDAEDGYYSEVASPYGPMPMLPAPAVEEPVEASAAHAPLLTSPSSETLTPKAASVGIVIPVWKRAKGETRDSVNHRRGAVYGGVRTQRTFQLHQLLRRFFDRQGEEVAKEIEEAGTEEVLKAMSPEQWTAVSKGTALDSDGNPYNVGELRYIERATVSVSDVLRSLGNDQQQRLAEILRAAGYQTIEIGGELAVVGIAGKEVSPFAITEAVYRDFAEHSLAAASGAMDTTRQRLTKGLSDIIAQDLVAGESSATIARHLIEETEKVYSALSLKHAAMIAKTETQGAMGAGAIEGYRFADVEKKSWMASMVRTRASHIAAHELYMTAPIPIDQPFIVGGESLMFPGDWGGSFGNTHNCACAVLPEEQE